MPPPPRSRLTTVAGTALGALLAVAATSDAVRRSRAYWWVSDNVANPFIRSLDPERAHSLAIWSLGMRLGPVAPVLRPGEQKSLEVSVWGRKLPHPVGMPAGFDKQATAFGAVLDMGFSFVEVGGVTPKPQPGNPKPRMWRLVSDRAVINRFGLNSDGHEAVARRLMRRNRDAHPGLVGVNLAKNTEGGDLVGDYVAGVRSLGPWVDFIVLNVSCPNVGWTKSLMASGGGGGGGGNDKDKDKDDGGVKSLVQAVQKQRDETCRDVPVLLKVGPDMDEGARRKMARIAIECGVDGLVVSNTTSQREGLGLTSADASQQGGLSGAPLKAKALATLKEMYRLTGGAIPIIGVGGIESGKDAYERIRAGATLVQIYTGMVFEGPGLVHRIRKELDELLHRDGFNSVAEAVGVDVDVRS